MGFPRLSFAIIPRLCSLLCSWGFCLGTLDTKILQPVGPALGHCLCFTSYIVTTVRVRSFRTKNNYFEGCAEKKRNSGVGAAEIRNTQKILEVSEITLNSSIVSIVRELAYLQIEHVQVKLLGT